MRVTARNRGLLPTSARCGYLVAAWGQNSTHLGKRELLLNESSLLDWDGAVPPPLLTKQIRAASDAQTLVGAPGAFGSTGTGDFSPHQGGVAS